VILAIFDGDVKVRYPPNPRGPSGYGDADVLHQELRVLAG
jgi:hypothetical protein